MRVPDPAVPPRIVDALDLADDLGEVEERMRHFGVATRDDGRMLAFEDPWANSIRITTAA